MRPARDTDDARRPSHRRALIQTVAALEKIGSERFKILLTIPPKPSHDGEEARSLLEERGLPLSKARYLG